MAYTIHIIDPLALFILELDHTDELGGSLAGLFLGVDCHICFAPAIPFEFPVRLLTPPF